MKLKKIERHGGGQRIKRRIIRIHRQRHLGHAGGHRQSKRRRLIKSEMARRFLEEHKADVSRPRRNSSRDIARGSQTTDFYTDIFRHAAF